MTATEKLIRDYATRHIHEYGDDETPAPILLAIDNALSSEEVRHLGRALLIRHDTISDPGYRLGQARCDADIRRIAVALGEWPADSDIEENRS